MCVRDYARKLGGGSMQPRRTILPHGLPDFGVDCHACLSCGMVVLLVMPVCSVFHNYSDGGWEG